MELILYDVSSDVEGALLTSLDGLHLKLSYPGQTLQAVAHRLQKGRVSSHLGYPISTYYSRRTGHIP